MVHRQFQTNDWLRFERLNDRLINEIVARFSITEEAVYAARGLFDASGQVDRQEWKLFADSLDRFLNSNVVALAYVSRVPAVEVSAFVDLMRGQGEPNFSVGPGG